MKATQPIRYKIAISKWTKNGKIDWPTTLEGKKKKVVFHISTIGLFVSSSTFFLASYYICIHWPCVDLLECVGHSKSPRGLSFEAKKKKGRKKKKARGAVVENVWKRKKKKGWIVSQFAWKPSVRVYMHFRLQCNVGKKCKFFSSLLLLYTQQQKKISHTVVSIAPWKKKEGV